tara:strand:- start:1171 stop:1608 length:438 start_codon:yes stop_codon:yes gene_type:complete
MADNYLTVAPLIYNKVLDYLDTGRKINAIKALREGAAPKSLGLKEAKHAVEKLAHDRAMTGVRGVDHPDAMIIVSGPRIVKVTLDYGDGPVDLDLENMQIKALSEMHAVGLDACADMLDMVDVFKAISEGREVRVMEDEPHPSYS